MSPLSNPVCFVIVKGLTQEIEALKEEIGNVQLGKAQQVTIPEPQHGRFTGYVLCTSVL